MSNPPSNNQIPSTMTAIKCDICQRVFDPQNPPIVENNFRFCADCHQKMRDKYGPFESDVTPLPKIKSSTKFILFGIPLIIIGYCLLGISYLVTNRAAIILPYWTNDRTEFFLSYWFNGNIAVIIGSILASIGEFSFLVGVLIKIISQGIREVKRN